jgi:antitoxin component of MazEF toxin-antitoxin module
METRRVIKTGTSRGLVLPAPWVRFFGLESGGEVEIVYNGFLVVKPPGLQVDAKSELQALLKISAK